MLNILTGDPNLYHSEDAKYSKQYKQLHAHIYGRDRNKLPDVVDFCVTKSIPRDFAVAKSFFDLSSDHSTVLVTLSTQALNQDQQTSLCSRHTNWDDFRHLTNEKLTINIYLQS
jgi:hypothetical protein